MKVLEIIGDSTLAGAPRHLLSLLENLNLKKFELYVICPPGPLAGEIRDLKKSIEVETVPMRSKLDISSIKTIRSLIKQLKVDLIHIHGTRAGFLARLSAVGMKVPVIYTEHLWTKQYRLKNIFKNQIQLIGLWFLDIFTTLNIAVSQAVKDFMIDSQISHPGKVRVIYNAIAAPRKQAKIFSSDKIILGTVGTLNFQKGIQYLIEAMPHVLREFPKIRLEIVGEGPHKAHLEKEVEKLKLSKTVFFTGFVKDIQNKMSEFDLYIQPSLSESFGLAIVQAMALGIPVVATNAGGIPEVVTTGKSGILVEPGHPKVIAEAIIELLRDKPRAKKMGKLGAEEAKIKFNLQDMIKETEKIYEEVAESGS
ncbi:MAG: glycosyltransferase family 4 protein [Patescibacteria group bacterium]